LTDVELLMLMAMMMMKMMKVLVSVGFIDRCQLCRQASYSILCKSKSQKQALRRQEVEGKWPPCVGSASTALELQKFNAWYL